MMSHKLLRERILLSHRIPQLRLVSRRRPWPHCLNLECLLAIRCHKKQVFTELQLTIINLNNIAV